VNEQQKQRAIAALTKWWAADSNKAVLSTGYEMAGVLQELIEQPTSVPVLTVECEPDYWSGGHYHEGTLPHIDPTAVWKLPIGTKLYTAPAAPEPEPFVWWSDADDVVFQSLHNGKHLPFDQRDAYLSAVEISSAIPLYTAPPAPSVPDGQLQAAFDRGLKAGNEQAIAQQIEIHKLHDLLAVQQPEQPTDLVRDAARYRWLRNWTRGAYGIDSNPAFILPHVPTMLDQNIMSGSVAQHLDNAIDAAIAAEKGGEGE